MGETFRLKALGKLSVFNRIFWTMLEIEYKSVGVLDKLPPGHLTEILKFSFLLIVFTFKSLYAVNRFFGSNCTSLRHCKLLQYRLHA